MRDWRPRSAGSGRSASSTNVERRTWCGTEGLRQARGRGPQSGHHSRGATRPSPTFIQSSVRCSLQVHNGPTRPSASMPVAPCTRVSSRAHPSFEQVVISSVMPSVYPKRSCSSSGRQILTGTTRPRLPGGRGKRGHAAQTGLLTCHDGCVAMSGRFRGGSLNVYPPVTEPSDPGRAPARCRGEQIGARWAPSGSSHATVRVH